MGIALVYCFRVDVVRGLRDVGLQQLGWTCRIFPIQVERDAGRIVMQAAVCISVKDGKGRAIPGAEVAILDKLGQEVFKGVTRGEEAEAVLVADAGETLSVGGPKDKVARGRVVSIALEGGTLRAILTRCILTSTGKDARTPHRITVTKKGYAETCRTVDAADAGKVEIVLAPQAH